MLLGLGGFNPSGTEVSFCHQNQNVKNIGSFTTLLKPHNIGTHLKGIEPSLQVVPLFLKSFWASYITLSKYHFLKIPSDFRAIILGNLVKSARYILLLWAFC
jgi:hypothetical protein